ncbi:hypothetical protein RIF29_05670 [Crotalaria pallida]|uniref:Uncharacterized protein n=1 Tax=Crotalaria pallida TaxID=3830 RepID=A0AAN9PB24_CROPI
MWDLAWLESQEGNHCTILEIFLQSPICDLYPESYLNHSSSSGNRPTIKEFNVEKKANKSVLFADMLGPFFPLCQLSLPLSDCLSLSFIAIS